MRLKHLKDHHDFIFKPADKNLGTVVISRISYISLCQSELLKMNLLDLTLDDINSEISDCLGRMREWIFPLLSAEFQKRIEPLFDLSESDLLDRVPVLYCLPKIHKPTLRGRPIVAAFAAPFRILSNYLGFRLNGLLKTAPWIREHLVPDSRSVVRLWEGISLPSVQYRLLGIAFDVVEMYPNVPTGHRARRLLRSFLRSQQLPDFELLCEILDLVLDHGWFRFRERYYCQKTGLAMGHGHSPPIANLLLYLLFERPFLCSHWD